jgi:hypothetical protein
LLPANYAGGAVTVYTGFEGDANGSGGVSATDYTLVGRIVAGLNTITDPGQFMRVDSAPRSTKGNGSITGADWTQTGRYVLGLDPIQPIGGSAGSAPSQSIPGIEFLSQGGEVAAQGNSDRTLRLVGAQAQVGEIVQIPVEFEAYGDENTVAFSLSFNPANLEYVSVASTAAMPQGAQALLNASNHSLGRIGVLIGVPPGATFTPGAHHLLVLTLRVKSAGNDPLTVVFNDSPVLREIVSSDAEVLPGNYVNASILVHNAQLALKLDVSQISDAGTRLTMTATPAQSYQILVSTNLTDWTELTTVVASSTGFVEAWDSEAKQHSIRFYRAVTQ